MSNVQTIQAKKNKSTRVYSTVEEAMEHHASDVPAFESVAVYKAWVDTQDFTETYALLDDKSGYRITKTYPSEEALLADVVSGQPGHQRDVNSVNGWFVEVVSNPSNVDDIGQHERPYIV
jgi:hypothetical protein